MCIRVSICFRGTEGSNIFLDGFEVSFVGVNNSFFFKFLLF